MDSSGGVARNLLTLGGLHWPTVVAAVALSALVGQLQLENALARMEKNASREDQHVHSVQRQGRGVLARRMEGLGENDMRDVENDMRDVQNDVRDVENNVRDVKADGGREGHGTDVLLSIEELRAETVGIEIGGYRIFGCCRDHFMWMTLVLALACFLHRLFVWSLETFLVRGWNAEPNGSNGRLKKAIYDTVHCGWMRHTFKKWMEAIAANCVCYFVSELAVLYYPDRKWPAYVLGFAVLAVYNLIFAWYKWNGAIAKFQKDNDGGPDWKKVYKAENDYMDLINRTIGQCVHLFKCQLVFFLMLVGCIVKRSAAQKPNLLFWSISIYAVQMGTMFCRGEGGQIGKPFQREFWIAAVHSAAVGRPPRKDDGVEHEHAVHSVPADPNSMIYARMALDFLANAVIRHSVAFSVPLLLMMSKNELDFILNCIAMGYIATIDDGGQGKIMFKGLREGLRGGRGWVQEVCTGVWPSLDTLSLAVRRLRCKPVLDLHASAPPPEHMPLLASG